MNLQQFLLALRGRSRLFFWILTGTVVAALAVSLIMPKTYVGTVSVIVDAKEGQSLSPASSAMPASQQIGYMQTQVDIIQSEAVARKVVRQLNLAANPEVQEVFNEENVQGTIEDWLVAGLLQKLKVSTTQSRVIQISYPSEDAKAAATVANTFAKAYIDTVLDLRVGPSQQAADWFDQQLKGLRSNLEKAQQRLTARQQATGITAPEDGRYDVESARLAELSSQLLRAQDQTYEIQSRQRDAQEYLGKGSAIESLPEVMSSPFINSLKADLVRGEARLQDLASQVGRNHPEYQRLVSENSALSDRIQREMKRVVSALDNTARQSTRRQQELAAALSAQRARVLELKKGQSEITNLSRDVESAQQAYQAAMNKLMVNRVEAQANSTNIAVLNPASPPLLPARPRLGLNIALALLVGTMLGLVVIYLLENFDRRVRGRNDLEAYDGVPVLGTLHQAKVRRQRIFELSATRQPLLPKLG